MSDRCEHPLGRRRPFIFALSLLAFVGITLILNGYWFGQLLGDNIRDVNNTLILFQCFAGIKTVVYNIELVSNLSLIFLIKHEHLHRA